MADGGGEDPPDVKPKLTVKLRKNIGGLLSRTGPLPRTVSGQYAKEKRETRTKSKKEVETRKTVSKSKAKVELENDSKANVEDAEKEVSGTSNSTTVVNVALNESENVNDEELTPEVDIPPPSVAISRNAIQTNSPEVAKPFTEVPNSLSDVANSSAEVFNPLTEGAISPPDKWTNTPSEVPKPRTEIAQSSLDMEQSSLKEAFVKSPETDRTPEETKNNLENTYNSSPALEIVFVPPAPVTSPPKKGGLTIKRKDGTQVRVESKRDTDVLRPGSDSFTPPRSCTSSNTPLVPAGSTNQTPSPGSTGAIGGSPLSSTGETVSSPGSAVSSYCSQRSEEISISSPGSVTSGILSPGTNNASFLSTRTSYDGFTSCRQCGPYHCFICQKCMTGLEPRNAHDKSERHLRKVCEKFLLEQALINRREQQSATTETSDLGLTRGIEVIGRRYSPTGGSMASSSSCTSSPRISVDETCPKCGPHHCFVCDKCMSGPEPRRDHEISEKHVKKMRKKALFDEASRPGVHKSSALEASPWMKYVDGDCTFIGCTHHCRICRKHVTGEDPAMQHYKSRDHIAMETRWESWSSPPRDAASELVEVQAAEFSRTNSKRDPVTVALNFTDPPKIGRNAQPATNVNSFNKIDTSYGFGSVTFVHTEIPSTSAAIDINDANEDDSPGRANFGGQVGMSNFSKTPFKDLQYSLVENGAKARETNNTQQQQASGESVLRTVDQRKALIEDLSVFDDGNYTYDISNEPDMVKIKPRKSPLRSDSTDDGWHENKGVQVTEEDLKNMAEEEEKRREQPMRFNEEWDKHFVESGLKMKEEEKQKSKVSLLDKSRLEPAQPSACYIDRSIISSSESVIESKRETETATPLIDSSCTYPGCVYHCNACDAHLSGLSPRTQHELSANHIRQAQIVKTGAESEGQVCTHPGCVFHCTVCNLHLSGVGPRDQHIFSLKHIQKAKSRGLATNEVTPARDTTNIGSANSPPAASSSNSDGDPAIGCFISICYHHCYPCNLHLNGPEHRKLHCSGRKHLSREQSYNDASAAVASTSTTAASTFATSSNSAESSSSSDADLDNYEAFTDCPQERDSCVFHCTVCDKHFSGVAPKLQHALAEKHKKAVINRIRAAKRPATDVIDGIVASSEPPVKKNEFALPDRSELPLVKSAPENDLDYRPNTVSEPREYQLEMFYKSRDKDSICFLPTGTGKTLVSAMMIDFMLEKNPWRPILFIVDKVLLVLQQTKYLRTEVGERSYKRYGVSRPLNIVGMCGGKIDSRGCRTDDIDVLVATAGLVENLIQQNAIRWLDFSLIVLDEIHHCEKEHPFRRLIDKQHTVLEGDKRPKLFGMTASPAAEMSIEASIARLRNLLRAVGDAKLCQVENCLLELDEHRSKTALQFVHVALSDAELQLQRSLQMHLLNCYLYLEEHSNIKKLELGIRIELSRPKLVNSLQFTDDRGENRIMNLRSNLDLVTARTGDAFMVRNVVDHVYVLCSALMGLTICGDIAAYKVLEELIVDNAPHSFKSMRGLRIDDGELLQTVKLNCNKLQIKGYVMSAIERGHSMNAYDKLMSIILHKVDWKSRNEGKQPIVLILVRERKTAMFLTEILQASECLKENSIRIASLIGHGKTGEGMTVAKQSRILGEIRDYFHQIIIATSVAEEGLDLPNCDLVIEMDPPGGITSLVQIRGRARQKESNLYSICRTDWQEVYIKRLILNEQHMYRAIEYVSREQDEDLEFGYRP